MADKTGIEWTDATWNPVIGCAKVSEGCRNCYAMGAAKRIVMSQRQREFGGGNLTSSSPYEKVVKMDDDLFPEAKWNGTAVFLPARLDQPIRWQKPRRIFVNSMSDLFHPDVTFEQIAAVFGVMAATPRHTFQVLTKRPERMLEFFNPLAGYVKPLHECLKESAKRLPGLYVENINLLERKRQDEDLQWPPPNVWLGVSAEDQATANERIPLLLQCPAAVHWVSAEPLLGPMRLGEVALHGAFDHCPDEDDECNGCVGWSLPGGDGCSAVRGSSLDWVVVGGESGPGARLMEKAWADSLRDECAEAGVPFLFKQWGAWGPVEGAGEMVRIGKKKAGRHLDGRTYDEYPEPR